MNNTTENLQNLPEKTAKKQTGIGALPRGIHRDPDSRSWVTLETIALTPIPIKFNQQCCTVSLLTLSQRLDDGLLYQPPWGMIIWSLTDKKVMDKENFILSGKKKDLPAQNPINVVPVSLGKTLDIKTRTLIENQLFALLDQLFIDPQKTDIDLNQLAPYYQKLFPQIIFDYYHRLFPESLQWLITENQPETSQVKVSESVDLQNIVSRPVREQNEDLSDDIYNWINQALRLTENWSLTDINSELIQLQKRYNIPGFKLALVGEFNRGKSRLINRLLGQNKLLPEAVLPSTATMTVITAGTDEKIIVNYGKNRQENRPLIPESWTDLLARDEQGNDQDVKASVTMTVNNEWLESLDIQLIDTPGFNDVNYQRVGILLDVIKQCDAVIFLCGATAPLQQTEREFLKVLFDEYHIQKMLIGVSFLDRLEEEERGQIMQYIQDKLPDFAKEIPVLPLLPLNKNQTDEEILTQFKQQITAMVNQRDRLLSRQKQVLGILLNKIQQMVEISKQAIAVEKMNPAAREKALKNIQNQREIQQKQWQKISLEIKLKAQKTAQKLGQNIREQSENLLEGVRIEVLRTNNCKFWWEKEFPFSLRRQLAPIERQLETVIGKLITEDYQWLQKTVNQQFKQQINMSMIEQNLGKEKSLELPELTIDEVTKYRTLVRIAGSLAVLGGYVFGGPIGVLTNTAIAILGENFLNATVERQKEIIQNKLPDIVNTALKQYCANIEKRVDNFYQQLLLETQKEQEKWQETTQKLLQETSNQSQITEKQIIWEKRLEQLLKLQAEIKPYLG